MLPLAEALDAATRVIAAVIKGRNADLALAALPAAVQPAARDLAFGALRSYGRGDFFLGRLLQKPLKDARLRALLLASLHRLEVKPEDAHTTVNQAVLTAEGIAGGRYKALVNAVLRNSQRRHDELAAAASADDVARWQHPPWWIGQLRRDHPREWQQVLAAGNARPPMSLRVNRRCQDTAAYLGLLDQAGIAANALDQYAILLEKPQPVGALPAFFEGAVSVQDWGAQRAAALLDVSSGMRVLDACAAPGGKTAHLLESADVQLTALDADATRLAKVADNLARLRLRADLEHADCRALEQWWDGRTFDRVLADVPCSASGVVRRHPDAKWLRRAADVASFATTQAQILDALWKVLAPGGKMLYCTCSVFAEENALQLAAFTTRHPDAERLPTGSARNELQLIPGAEHDGFYYALLAKRA